MTVLDQPNVRPGRSLIPVTILTGFLGAGKTTLLNRLLGDPALAGTAVIINEFGEIGLDHLMVESADEGIIELAAGCLCCTIRGELAITLENLLRGIDNGRTPDLSRIVIETTGLADPVPVIQSILLHPYLPSRFRIDGVVTVVDAVNGAASIDTQPEAMKQVAIADRLVLTKTDLPEADPKIALRLHRLNPGAPILDASRGEATPAALVDVGLFDPAAKSDEVRAWLAEEAFEEHAHGHDHDGLGFHTHHHGDHDHDHEHDDDDEDDHHHHHDVNRHGDDIRAFSVASGRSLSRAALANFLELLASAHGPKLLRVKGIVRVTEEPERPVVIQGAQSLFHPPLTLDRWPDADKRSRLVFITRDLPESFVQRMFDAFAGELRPDQPDAAALLDNPLAMPSARRN